MHACLAEAIQPRCLRDKQDPVWQASPACRGMRGSTGSVWSCFKGTTSKGLCDAPGLNRISTLKRSGLSTGTLRIPQIIQRGHDDVVC